MIKDANFYKALIIDELYDKFSIDIIATEVPYLYGNRKADLVFISNGNSIAFEIKSELDNLSKPKEQIEDYVTVFNKVYVVIAEKFKNSKEIKDLPKNIGIIIEKNATLKLKRTAKIKKILPKDKTVYFLYKNDMIAYLKTNNYISINTARELFTKKYSDKQVYDIVLQSLLRRYNAKYKLFCNDRGNYTHKEDLRYLTGLRQDLNLF